MEKLAEAFEEAVKNEKESGKSAIYLLDGDNSFCLEFAGRDIFARNVAASVLRELADKVEQAGHLAH